MNQDGALYMASGIDNTGLQKGKQEAVGIVRTLMREVTSFDVFAGIGLSAATAFAIAGKQAYEFEKKFETSMLEVATLSDIVSESLDTYKQKIVDLTTSSQIPIYADEAAKALYQIVSAGHDGADGMIVLEASAKAAVGGVTDTATAADAITSILNAYGKSAKDAERISDMLFMTVKLGKTTMGELGKSISQVTSISAAYGIEIEEVLAAVSTLTSSGTPTAMAMTQIKAAITQASVVLGDGAFKTRTFQEGLNEIIAQSNGSESALKALIPSVEAVNGILGLTGVKAQKSANDLHAIGNAAGAADAAFKLMAESTENQLKLLTNNITASLRPLGIGILKEVSTISKGLNDAFASGDLENVLKTIKGLLITGAAAWGSYTVAITLNKIARQAYNSVAVMDIATKTTNLALTKANTVAIIKQTLAQAKSNVVAMLNPYTAIAASIALLTYTIYRHVTALSAQEKAQKLVNDRYDEQKRKIEDERSSVESLIETIKDETKTRYNKQKALATLQSLYPNIFANLDMEEVKNLNLTDTIKLLNIELEKRNDLQNAQNLKSSKALLDKKDGSFRWSMDERGEALDLMGEKDNTWNRLNFFTSGMDDAFKEYVKKSEEAEKQRKEIAEKAYGETENDAKEVFEDINKRVSETKKNISSLEKDLANLRSGKAQSSNLEADITAKEEALKKANDTLKTLTGIDESKNKDKVDASKDVNKILQDLELQNIKDTISIMEDGADKQREQIKADYDVRMSVLDEKEKELRNKQNGNLTKRQQEELEQSKQLANLIKEKETTQVDKKESDDSKEKLAKQEKEWNEYYIAYGTYQEKKLAITEEYARQISEAEGNVWKQQSLGKERDQALQDLDVSMAQQSDLWIRLFSDAEKLTTSSLQKIIQETQSLLDYLNGVEGAEVPIGFSPEQLDALKKDPEKVKSILDGMKQKVDLMNQRNPFGSVIQGFKDLKKAGSDTEKQMEATQKIIKGFGQVSDVVNQVGQAFTGISPEMDKVIGGITSIVGETSSMATTGAMLGGPVGAAIGGAIGLGTSLIKVFGSSNEMSQETIKNYQDYMSVIDELISKQKELIQSTSGSQAVIEAEKAKKLIEAQIKASREIGKEFLNSGASGGFLGIGSSASEGVKLRKALDPFRNELRKAGVDLNSLGDRMTGLFDLTADQLLRIKQEIPKLWAKLDDATRQYLEAIIDGDEKLNDLIETTQEAITGITFDEAKDSLKALLMDADTTFENISGKFDDYMRNSIMNLVMDGSMKQKLKEWYEDYAKALSDGKLKESEVDGLRNQYESIMKDAMEERDNLLKAAGLDPKKNESGVTGELKAEITEGTGSQLVGLWNMTAMDVRVIKDYIAKFGFNDISKELNVLLYHLNDIKMNTRDTADNTAYTEEGFKKLEDKLDKIEKNTKQNISRG